MITACKKYFTQHTFRNTKLSDTIKDNVTIKGVFVSFLLILMYRYMDTQLEEDLINKK